MKTIAKQLNVTKFPFIIKNSNDNEIYYEGSDGYWWKQEFDSVGNQIYFENSDGFWWKREFDSNSNEIYYENSNGEIIDKRQTTIELTLDEIADKFNINIKDLKIKK